MSMVVYQTLRFSLEQVRLRFHTWWKYPTLIKALVNNNNNLFYFFHTITNARTHTLCDEY